MTGDDVITAARSNFGEEVEMTLLDTQFEDWVNQAIKEVYNLLPATELRPRVLEDAAVASTAGKSDIDDTWDRIVEVEDDSNTLAVEVPYSVITSIDTYPTYFQPDHVVYAQRGNELYVRPDPGGNITVRYTQEPDDLTTFTSDLTTVGVPLRYHSAVVDLVTAYAYAQEEDAEQALAYRRRALTELAARGAALGEG